MEIDAVAYQSVSHAGRFVKIVRNSTVAVNVQVAHEICEEPKASLPTQYAAPAQSCSDDACCFEWTIVL
jgi:hypothetical protein